MLFGELYALVFKSLTHSFYNSATERHHQCCIIEKLIINYLSLKSPLATKFSIQQEPGFYLDRDKATMPKFSGIYVVYTCNYDSFSETVDVKEVLYIGETKNIYERHNGIPDQPTNHEHYDDFVKEAGGTVHICYGVIPMDGYPDEDRKWIQDAMIYSQKPPINDGNEKEHYTHPAIDLTLNGFPNCWKTFYIILPVNVRDKIGIYSY